MEKVEHIEKIAKMEILALVDILSKDIPIAPEMNEDFPEGLDNSKVSSTMKLAGNCLIEPLIEGFTSGEFSIGYIKEILMHANDFTDKITSLYSARKFKNHMAELENTFNSEIGMEVQ